MKVGIILLTLASLACGAAPGVVAGIQAGQTRDDVITIAGEPDETLDLTLPDGPFFGPQEALTDLLPAGTLVEEWQYVSGDEVTYVWFAGAAGDARGAWTVIAMTVVPADAVF